MSLKYTLLLDSTYRPINIIPWQKAICLLVQNKAEIVEAGVQTVRSPTIGFKVPAVLKLIRKHIFTKEAAFTKRSIFLRDSYTCGYCQQVFSIKELTVDHVVPRCQGGGNNFKNTVTACTKCNNKKGGRTPEEARMPLKIKPRIPSGFEILIAEIRNTEQYKRWTSQLEPSLLL